MSTISAGTTVGTALALSGDTTGALTFQVSGTVTAATITAAGNFGIGTTSPGYRLDTQTATSITQARFSNSATGGATITSTGASQAIWAGGTEFNGTAFVARATTSSQIRTDSGLVTFFTNDSLTSGNTFTPTERMRITAAGNVGIGSTTPGTYSERLVVASPGSAQASMMLMNPGQGSGQLGIAASGSNFKIYNTFTDGLLANGKGIDITSTGNVLLGTSTGLGEGARLDIITGDGEADVTTWRYNNAGAGKYWRWAIDSNSRIYLLNQGAAGVYLDDGSTAWAAYSDERAKTDLKPIEDSVNKVCQLRAVTGRFKKDDEGVSRSFLIAQDVQKVFPEAVSDINPDELGVRYTDVIPLLVAAVKELKAENDALKARIEALESK